MSRSGEEFLDVLGVVVLLLQVLLLDFLLADRRRAEHYHLARLLHHLQIAVIPMRAGGRGGNKTEGGTEHGQTSL